MQVSLNMLADKYKDYMVDKNFNVEDSSIVLHPQSNIQPPPPEVKYMEPEIIWE